MKFMVAFSSPKRSAKTVEMAAQHAKALGAELILVRVIADPHKVGVIAELIATDRPADKAKEQVEAVAAELRKEGLNASGIVKVDEVAQGIVKAVLEYKVDLLFLGTVNVVPKPAFVIDKDPIAHYAIDHCPISVCLVRQEDLPEEEEANESYGQYT